MRRIISIIILFGILNARGQDNATLRNHYLKVYSQAIAYNDVNAAINALQGYIATDDNMNYKDTLSMLYFSSKSYISSLLLAEEVYKAVPANLEAMARAAECYDELGDPKTAVGLYEQVVPKTKNPYHIYKLAVGQYQLKRTLECENSANLVLRDTTSKKIGVNFAGRDGRTQAVPVNAAAANLLGVIKMDAKDYAGAKLYFQQALSLYAKFDGAKQNMDLADKNLTGAKAPSKPAAKTK
jgi:tetratricopeptide (TPR) repeat protein